MESSIVRSPDGYRWLNNGPGSDDHLAFGGHEPGLAPFMELLSSPHTWYLNIGAHVGTWAIRMAKFNARVYAIEANVNTYQTLKENVWLNDLGTTVHPLRYAIWDEDHVPLSLIDENDKETGGSTRAIESETGMYSVTLDTLFEAWANNIGFISMDVEGAEAKVLSGAREILEVGRPNLLIELHEGHPGTDPLLRQQVYDILDEHNYSYNSLFVAPPEEHIMAQPAETLQTFEAS